MSFHTGGWSDFAGQGWQFLTVAYTKRMMEPAPSTLDTHPDVRPDIISEAFLATLRAHGVVRAQLFGSMVDHTDGPDSDIDLLVTFDRPVSLFEEMDLAEELQQVSGRRVDLMTKLHPVFAPYITPTLVSIRL